MIKSSVRVASAVLLCAFASSVFAKTCSFNVEGTDQMKYNVDKITVTPDCTEVAITLKHTGKLPAQAMGHNWVLAKTEDFQAIANAGMASGFANDYLPKDDKRIIAHTKIVGGGESTTVQFGIAKLTKGGDYTFFCSFPGHSVQMKGKFIVG
jgi:azurin